MNLLRSKEKFYREWLQENSPWFRNKLWQVLVELKAEQELTGSDSFKIPLDRFKKKNIDLEDTKKILINLDSRKIIFTFLELNRTPPSDDPLKPTGSIGLGVKDSESVFYSPKTNITLSHEFKYLYVVLEKIQHPEKKKTLGSLDKKADGIINQFSLENIPFVSNVLKGIVNAVGFSLKGEVHYNLQSASGTSDLPRERQLLRKFESMGLFRHDGEDGIFGIASLRNIKLPLINKCIERGRRRLAMEELRKRRMRAETQKIVNASPQNSLVSTANRWLGKRKEDEIGSKLKKIDEIEEKLKVLEQQNTKKITPTQIVKEIMKQYKFPKMQKKLVNKLASTLPKDTKILKTEVGTNDLPSLKRDTLVTINEQGLSKILSIKSFKGSFGKHFYQLNINSQHSLN